LKNKAFWRELHFRGVTADTIADAICSARCHVTKVLNGSIPGKPTRRKILKKALLTEAEVKLLGWEVPHGTKF